MKLLMIVFGLVLSTANFALEEQNSKQNEQISITRLEALRAECLIRNSGNQRLCHKKVLKQCQDTMQKRECLLIMSKMQKSKMPRTNGPGLI